MGKVLRGLNTSPNLPGAPSQHCWLETWLRSARDSCLQLARSTRGRASLASGEKRAKRGERAFPAALRPFSALLSLQCFTEKNQGSRRVHLFATSLSPAVPWVQELWFTTSALLLQEFCTVTEPGLCSAKPLAHLKSKEGCKCY